MEKVFNAQAIERHWSDFWEKSGFYQPSGQGEPYCIVIPPPNVTGSLHMGHGFQQTLMDVLIRYHRMKGNNTLWVVGTDHAGIATQMVVERQLAAKGESRQALGREAFLQRVWDWKHTSENTITSQIRRLGASVDWSREAFTMDDGLSDAVQEVFIRLYEEGLIYRGQRLVNWDPVFQTAISDLEVINQEEKGSLWYIHYPIQGSKEYLTIATTRPETMLGDVAVAVHPEDERYRHLIGQFLQLPLCNRTIPIIADDYVDPEFGTGCVKITPAHDFNDYEMGQRHNLPMINILTKDAHLNENVPEPYRGLTREAARKKVVADLESNGLLEKVEDHTLSVPRGDRSNAIIEPYLTEQWYVKAKPLAEPAIAAVKNGDINFIPENWEKTYFQWLENIQDWCISRQLWWGHRIPAWYDDQGNIYVGRNEQEVRSKNNIPSTIVLRQDEDVLDTWFSSALWPFSTLGWPKETEDFNTFFPTDVLVTGFDIIFFWVARMIMMSLHFTKKIPFKEVYITGLIRDHDGQKMSKSKGNVLDPIDLIDGISLDDLINKRTGESLREDQAKKIANATKKQFPNGIAAYGTDALRFTFCALATQGRDIRFEVGRLEGYRNFCNKIWNAARYILLQCENQTVTEPDNFKNLHPIHIWILQRLKETCRNVDNHVSQYRFDLLAQTIYEFFWYVFCDWYLELTKPILQGSTGDENDRAITRWVLLHVMETTLRLSHPLIPFITEEVWHVIASQLNKDASTIMNQPYPVEADFINLPEGEEIGGPSYLIPLIEGIRNARSENNIAPQQKIKLNVRSLTGSDLTDNDWLKKFTQNYLPWFEKLAGVSEIHWLGVSEQPPLFCATFLYSFIEIFIPLQGIVDYESEITRLEKNLLKLAKEKAPLEARLQQTGIPDDIRKDWQNRLVEINESEAKFKERLTQTQALCAQQ